MKRAPATALPHNFCADCGKKFTAEAKFCVNCGCALQQAVQKSKKPCIDEAADDAAPAAFIKPCATSDTVQAEEAMNTVPGFEDKLFEGTVKNVVSKEKYLCFVKCDELRDKNRGKDVLVYPPIIPGFDTGCLVSFRVHAQEDGLLTAYGLEKATPGDAENSAHSDQEVRRNFYSGRGPFWAGRKYSHSTPAAGCWDSRSNSANRAGWTDAAPKADSLDDFSQEWPAVTGKDTWDDSCQWWSSTTGSAETSNWHRRDRDTDMPKDDSFGCTPTGETFVGVIKRTLLESRRTNNITGTYGFIKSDEFFAKYRSDCFVRGWLIKDFHVGQRVEFDVAWPDDKYKPPDNKHKAPRAIRIRVIDEDPVKGHETKGEPITVAQAPNPALATPLSATLKSLKAARSTLPSRNGSVSYPASASPGKPTQPQTDASASVTTDAILTPMVALGSSPHRLRGRLSPRAQWTVDPATVAPVTPEDGPKCTPATPPRPALQQGCGAASWFPPPPPPPEKAGNLELMPLGSPRLPGAHAKSKAKNGSPRQPGANSKSKPKKGSWFMPNRNTVPKVHAETHTQNFQSSQNDAVTARAESPGAKWNESALDSTATQNDTTSANLEQPPADKGDGSYASSSDGEASEPDEMPSSSESDEGDASDQDPDQMSLLSLVPKKVKRGLKRKSVPSTDQAKSAKRSEYTERHCPTATKGYVSELATASEYESSRHDVPPLSNTSSALVPTSLTNRESAREELPAQGKEEVRNLPGSSGKAPSNDHPVEVQLANLKPVKDAFAATGKPDQIFPSVLQTQLPGTPQSPSSDSNCESPSKDSSSWHSSDMGICNHTPSEAGSPLPQHAKPLEQQSLSSEDSCSAAKPPQTEVSQAAAEKAAAEKAAAEKATAEKAAAEAAAAKAAAEKAAAEKAAAEKAAAEKAAAEKAEELKREAVMAAQRAQPERTAAEKSHQEVISPSRIRRVASPQGYRSRAERKASASEPTTSATLCETQVPTSPAEIPATAAPNAEQARQAKSPAAVPATAALSVKQATQATDETKSGAHRQCKSPTQLETPEKNTKCTVEEAPLGASRFPAAALQSGAAWANAGSPWEYTKSGAQATAATAAQPELALSSRTLTAIQASGPPPSALQQKIPAVPASSTSSATAPPARPTAVTATALPISVAPQTPAPTKNTTSGDSKAHLQVAPAASSAASVLSSTALSTAPGISIASVSASGVPPTSMVPLTPAPTKSTPSVQSKVDSPGTHAAPLVSSVQSPASLRTVPLTPKAAFLAPLTEAPTRDRKGGEDKETPKDKAVRAGPAPGSTAHKTPPQERHESKAPVLVIDLESLECKKEELQEGSSAQEKETGSCFARPVDVGGSHAADCLDTRLQSAGFGYPLSPTTFPDKDEEAMSDFSEDRSCGSLEDERMYENIKGAPGSPLLDGYM